MDTVKTVMFLLAGLGTFMVGFKVLSENISKLATNTMRKMFDKISSNKLAGVAVGAGATALMQSSAATTVMLIGFVNAGLITLYQAVPIIMGANIGTTVTAIILSLDAIDVPLYAMGLALVGVFGSMVVKKERTKTLFLALAGMGLVFFGLKTMSTYMSVVAEQPFVQDALSSVSFPLLLLLLGAVFTIIMQSSTAVTGILLSMAASGIVIGNPGGNGIYFVILGTNIGTCFTALLSSVGASVNAKRTAMIHLLFNVIGSLIFLIILWIWSGFNAFWSSIIESPQMQIALFHMAFNLLSTLMFLPISNLFVKITQKLVPDEKVEEKKPLVVLDDRLLRAPGVAVGTILNASKKMASISMSALTTAFMGFIEKKPEAKEKVNEYFKQSGEINAEITSYLVKLAAQNTGYRSEKIISAVHESIIDLNRLTEIADNITRYTDTYINQELVFSDIVIEELTAMFAKIGELYSASIRALDLESRYDIRVADRLEDEVDGFKKSLLDGHMKRLAEGKCRPESSGVFINLVNNLERAGDHLSFLATAFYNANR